jgi:TolA-binding protein
VKRRPITIGLLVLLLAGVASSCAYYNTFYLARRYYMKATDGQPYEVDRESSAQRVNYNKSADYSKKVLGVHPKSKWVDDAWLMWARTFVGTDDPLKAVAMLQEFETRFPQSDLRPDAEFFLGLSYRLARKYDLAVDHFDNFLAQAPKHELVPYAWYERSRAMLALSRAEEASKSAGQVIERFPNHVLVDRALRQRAEARYLQRDWSGARDDFRTIGLRALTDDDRFRYLLREVDCLESNRQYEEARAVLRDARSHVPVPPPVPEAQRVGLASAAGSAAAVTQTQPVIATVAPGQDRYGRLTLRMGGVELLAGRVKEAVEYYQTVLHDYPRTQLAAEAQYRIAYAYETGADDFARARAEYEKVKSQTGQSQFSQQADQRLENLARIERFRTASGADSAERKAESRFLTAEHYLFNLDRPERALAEYRAIADSSPSSAVVARALNAQAWLLARKLNDRAAGDSLFWKVVREHPGTEAQIAARDYLEAGGQSVPASLIVPPKEPVRPLLDLGDSLTRPPRGTTALGGRTSPFADPTRLGSPTRAGTMADSLRRLRAQRDSVISLAQSDTSAAGRAHVDSLRRAFLRPDTTGRGAVMAEIERGRPRPESVVVAPEDTPPPTLGAREDAERVRLEGAAPVTRTTLPDVRDVQELTPVRGIPDSAGHDTTRAGRARSATMNWLTGSDLRARRPADTPLPRVWRDSAGVRHAIVPDSLRKFSPTSSQDPNAPNFLPESASPSVTAPATPPEPAKPRGITSFERKDKATKLREREERERAKAVRDSVQRVKKAQKELERAQEKALKAQKGKKPATPPAPVVPDSAAIGKARRDSLDKLVAPPAAAPAPPDSAKRDTTSSPRR